MATLAEIRQQYPQYQDLSDEALADGLYQKFYSDMPRDEFNRKIGLSAGAPEPEAPRQISDRAEQIRQTIEGPPPMEGGTEHRLVMQGSQFDWLSRQQAIERNLRSQGKSDAEIERNPEWQEASRNLNRAVMGTQSQGAIGVAGGDVAFPMAGNAVALLRGGVTRGAVGQEFSRGGLEGLSRVISPPGAPRAVGRFINRVSGADAQRATEGLRQTGQSLAGQEIAGQETAAAEAQRLGAAKTEEGLAAQRRADQIAAQQRQIEEGRATAEQRAAQRVPGVDPLRQRVLAAARLRAQQAEADYRAAGATTEEAKGLVTQRDAQVAQAEQGVAELEQRLLAQPQMDAATFGQHIRRIAQGIADRFGAIRAREADFPGAIRSAGDQPRVATGDILQMIEAKQKNVGNPTLRRTLDHIADELKTDDQPALNVEKAESLRKYLDSIINSKTINTDKGPLAVDKEALAAVKEIKKALVSNATAAWPPYRRALERWSTLSRPLDIVERKGSLRKVIERDPVSTSYASSEADVVGQLIKKSGKGNPAFDRLVAEVPEIRDSARLYFTKQLFGEGPVTTEAGFRTFLKNNEGSLKQLGLYDEFKNLRVARQTAQRAVDDAKDARVLSAKDAKVAAEAETAQKRKVAVAETVRDLARKRAEEGAEATVLQRKIITKESEGRAGEATKRLAQQEKDVRSTAETAGKEAKKAETAAEKARDTANSMRLVTEKLNAARPGEIASVTRSLVEGLKDTMTPARYGQLLRQIQNAEDRLGQTAAARAQMKRISQAALYASIAGGTAYSTYRLTQSLIP